MNKSRIWILGADDPEMAAIERLLTTCGERIVHATVSGQRVHPGNAYRSDTPRDDLVWDNGRGTIYTIECSWEHLDGETGDVCTIDHHRSGDPGYGVPPSDFLQGSSLGQVISELARLGLLTRAAAWRRYCGPQDESVGAGDYWRANDGTTYICTGGEAGDGCGLVVPSVVLFASAADHCLGAAYAGQCPGVDVAAFGEWRTSARARWRMSTTDPCPHCLGTGRVTDTDLDDMITCPSCETHFTSVRRDVRSDIERATERVRSSPIVYLRLPEPWLGDDGVADLRGEEIPELPEAACRLGVAYLATPRPGPDGRRKVVLQCASPAHLAEWPAWAAANGIVDCYGGDPARGFAGGYYA